MIAMLTQRTEVEVGITVLSRFYLQLHISKNQEFHEFTSDEVNRRFLNR